MINTSSKIFIAGHTGMVGSHIFQKFTAKKFENIIVKTRNELDLFEPSSVNNFFKKEKPECVILAAARVGGIKANMTYSADFLYENLLIQNNVIWSALKNNVRKLLFLGSSCIYPRSCQQPMKEEYFMTGPVEPTNEGYAIAKIAGMKLCQKIFEQYGKPFISCMPTNVYGPHDHFGSDTSHVIPALISRMHQAKLVNAPSVTIWGTGQSRREFLYVEDLADAIFWLMNEYEKPDFLNIGTGEDISISELAELIQDIVQYKGNIIFDATKPDGMPRKLLDSSRINKCGWSHSISLTKGLEKTYDWFLSHSALSEQSVI